MITLADKIHADLKVHAGILTKITANDIHWIEAPQGSSVNRIVFKRIADVPIYDCDDRFQRWRFYVQHVNRYECERLAEILYGHLHRKDDAFGTFAVDYISCVMNNDPEFVSDLNAFEAIQDYTIYYH